MDLFWLSLNFTLAWETPFYKQQWRQSFLSCKSHHHVLHIPHTDIAILQKQSYFVEDYSYVPNQQYKHASALPDLSS